jgi:hypothetical protein
VTEGESPVDELRDERTRLVDDLERRIDELEGLDESAFGGFSALDWLICLLGAVVIPCLALVWFAE